MNSNDQNKKSHDNNNPLLKQNEKIHSINRIEKNNAVLESNRSNYLFFYCHNLIK